MHQNRRLLLEKNLSIAKAPIFASVSHTISLTQQAGRLFDNLNLSNDLLLTQELLSIKLGVASNTLTLSQVIAAIRRNIPEESTLVLSDDVATNVDYVRSLVNTLVLTHSVTGYLANRIPPPVPGVCPEEPLEAFTLEEVP